MIKRTLPERIRGFFLKTARVSPSLPAQINIEISTACNLKCKMCKRQTIDFGNSLMTFETFEKILDKIPKEVKTISFGGYGEILLNSAFPRMVRLCKERGFYTATTSNGTLLASPNAAEKVISSGLDEIRISIDHIKPPNQDDVGHSFSPQMLENLSLAAQAKKRLKSHILLGINTVVTGSNIPEIPEIVKTADALGFDLVELIRLDACLNKAKDTLSLDDERNCYKDVEKMKKQIKVVTPLTRFAKWRKLYLLKGPFCIFRHETAHIRINGAVTPCAFGFPVQDFGSIHSNSLKDIWDGKKMRSVRENPENTMCKNCNLFKPMTEKSQMLPVIQ